MADAPAAAAVAEIAGVAVAAVAVIDIAAAGIAAAGIAVDHDTAANCRDILCMGRPQCSQDTRRRHSWRGTRCSRRRRTIHSQSC